MYSTEKTEKWFARYVDSFRVDGALENMQELKRKHSRRVCAIACAIAESLEWNEEHDAWLAHAIGLLHDTGALRTVPRLQDLRRRRELRPRRTRRGDSGARVRMGRNRGGRQRKAARRGETPQQDRDTALDAARAVPLVRARARRRQDRRVPHGAEPHRQRHDIRYAAAPQESRGPHARARRRGGARTGRGARTETRARSRTTASSS